MAEWARAKGPRIAVSLVVLGTLLIGSPTAASAADGVVVINELHYHPTDDPDETNNLDDDEFLELHNPGDTAVDLSGYTFGPDGDPAIRLDQPLSGTLEPGAFAILAPAGADTLGRWGVSPIATYTGKLANGGELIELLSGSGAVVDSVDWDDASPWPGTPDGDGPSLELIDPLADNAFAANWAPSDGDPTPSAINSAVDAADSFIQDVNATPNRPAAGQAISVTASSGAASLNVVYLVGFGAEQTLPMAATGDGFSATIPGQAAGELVRYRIEDPATGATSPDGNDGRRWHGVVVADPAASTNMDLVEWFIPEADYDLMFDNPFDEIYVSGSVMVVNGVVYDNIDVKIRGGVHSREINDKLALSVDLPSGVTMNDPNLVPYPVDEFALSSEVGWTYGRQLAAWSLYESAGFPAVHDQHVRVQRNGEFYGIYRLTEKLDNRWRDGAGITGDFYKGANGSFHNSTDGFEKKQGDDDYTPIRDLGEVLFEPSSPAKTEYLYDELDIPNVVNFLAVSFLIGHYDTWDQNFYMHDDTEDTELWQVYPWDLSDTFGVGACDANGFDFGCIGNPLWDSILEVPELEQMVYRRVRTLMDGPMSKAEIDGLIADYHPTVSPAEMALDVEQWDAVEFYYTTALLTDEIDIRRELFEELDDVPASQTGTPRIRINEIQYDPADGGVEYVELYNPTPNSVDLSGWELDGVKLTIDGGTVILPSGYVVLTESIPDFQAAYPAAERTLLVQFDGGLKKAGERLTLIDADGTTIETVTYRSTGEWPTGPDGNGPSLELVGYTTDHTLGTSWATSDTPAGTPGAANQPVTGPEDRTPPILGPAEDQIVRLYQAVFGRRPDAAGMSFWLDRYQSGATLVEVAAAMAGTEEFTNRYGSDPTNADLVDGLYQNVLGRAGDAAGRDFWIGSLDDGALTQAQVIIAFSDSPENITRTETGPPLSSQQSQVLRLYQAIFDRAPDDEGFEFWTAQVAGGLSLADMATQFESSDEFQQRYGPNLSDEQLVDALYQNVLGRPGDPAGRAFWIEQLTSGELTRSDVLVAFSESKENLVRTGTAR